MVISDSYVSFLEGNHHISSSNQTWLAGKVPELAMEVYRKIMGFFLGDFPLPATAMISRGYIKLWWTIMIYPLEIW